MISIPVTHVRASQVGLVVKNLPTSAGDIRGTGLISGSGRSPGGGHATRSSIPAWEVYRGDWQAIVHRVTKSQTRLYGLSIHAYFNRIHFLKEIVVVEMKGNEEI